MAKTKKQVKSKNTDPENCTYRRKDGSICAHKRVDVTVDYCLLHLPDEAKNKVDFNAMLEDEIDNQRDNHLVNIEGIYFNTPFRYESHGLNDLESISAHNTVFAEKADFRGIIVKKEANFANSTFKKDALFGEASFEGKARFSEVTFEKYCQFTEATFSRLASFHKVAFKDETDFDDAFFKDDADFANSKFEKEAFFDSCKFNKEARFQDAIINDGNFNSAKFDGSAMFRRTELDYVYFSDTIFSKNTSFQLSKLSNVEFVDAVFEGELDFSYLHYHSSLVFRRSDIHKVATFAGAKFSNLSFDNTEFHSAPFFQYADLGNANFHNIDFPWGTIFRWANISEASFYDGSLEGVLFSNCKGLENCQFIHPRWLIRNGRWTLADEVIARGLDEYKSMIDEKYLPEIRYQECERSYREIRANYEQHKNYPDAGQFHFGEMEMRRLGISNRFRRTFSLETGYWLFGGYGERWLWAFLSVASFLLIGTLVYASQGFTETSPKTLEPYTSHSFLRAFVLSFKVSLLRDSFAQSKTAFTTVVMLFQSIIGPVSIGLLALAIGRKLRRN